MVKIMNNKVNNFNFKVIVLVILVMVFKIFEMMGIFILIEVLILFIILIIMRKLIVFWVICLFLLGFCSIEIVVLSCWILMCLIYIV